MRDAPWAHRVYMGNLPFDMEAEDIAAFFREKVGCLGDGMGWEGCVVRVSTCTMDERPQWRSFL